MSVKSFGVNVRLSVAMMNLVTSGTANDGRMELFSCRNGSREADRRRALINADREADGQGGRETGSPLADETAQAI